jgi:hypothetical protein
MEYMHEDDKFVYTLKAVRPSFPLPQLRFFHAVLGCESLKFKLFLRSIPCVAILDSVATHSFVSRDFCRKHRLHYSNVTSSALLADGTTSLAVVGVM